MNNVNKIIYKTKFCLYKNDERVAAFDEFDQAYFKACEYFNPPDGWVGKRIEYSLGEIIEIKAVPTRVK